MLHNVRKTRIEWSDCDPAGIIFYPRYFEIFDTGTTALFERAFGMTKIDHLKAFDFAGHPVAQTRALSPTHPLRAMTSVDAAQRADDAYVLAVANVARFGVAKFALVDLRGVCPSSQLTRFDFTVRHQTAMSGLWSHALRSASSALCAASGTGSKGKRRIHSAALPRSSSRGPSLWR
jgi:hypothetical protein